jgi:hypothetical protein
LLSPGCPRTHPENKANKVELATIKNSELMLLSLGEKSYSSRIFHSMMLQVDEQKTK